MKVAFFATYNWIANLIDKLKLCWQRAGVAIAGYMGDMKVNVLTILQNMVNGAIDIINKFIGLLNKIPGVSIDAVEQVTFATTAKAENEAAKQARADALNKYESDIKAAQAQRDATYSAAKKELADATAALSKTYANAKAEAAQAKSDVGATDWNVDGTNDVRKVDSVGSVGKIDSDVNIADEDLKFLRDVAEMRYVQNFVTLTPTVAVEAQISERSTSTKSSNGSKASWKTNSQRRRKECITNEQLPNDTDRRWTGNQHSRPSGETERVFAWEK